MSTKPLTVMIDHVGLCVGDIEAATAFLQAAVGAEISVEILGPGDEHQAGFDTEQRFGLVGGAVITAIRKLRLGQGAQIELFQIEAPDQREPARASDLGWQHIAVLTDDLDAALERFAEAGGQVLPAPHVEGSGTSYRYARAPFGALIEFVAYAS